MLHMCLTLKTHLNSSYESNQNRFKNPKGTFVSPKMAKITKKYFSPTLILPPAVFIILFEVYCIGAICRMI